MLRSRLVAATTYSLEIDFVCMIYGFIMTLHFHWYNQFGLFPYNPQELSLRNPLIYRIFYFIFN